MEEIRMKKITALLLVLAMVVLAFACAPAPATQSTEPPAESSAAPAESSAAPAESSAAPAESSAAPAESGDGSLQKVKDKGVFVLGLDDSFPPYGYSENGEVKGFDIDLAKEVCSRLGVELKTQPINWDTKVSELNDGNIDCIWNGFTITEEMEAKVLFTKPYVRNTQIIVVKTGSDIASKADLAGKIVGVQNGSSANDAIDNEPEVKDTFGELVAIDDNVSALMELKNGTVDAVVLDEAVGLTYVNNEPDVYSVLSDNFGGEEYGIGFRLTDNELMSAVQTTLDDMRADGTFAEIVKKWPAVTGAIQ